MSHCQCRECKPHTSGGSLRSKAVAAGAVVVLAAAVTGASRHGHRGHGILDSVPAPPGLSQGNPGQQAWARAVLRAGHWPRTSANITSLAAWSRREAPWNAAPPDGAKYTRNPLNLTYGPGAIGSVPNTPNVSILPSWTVSAADTADRISQSDYTDVASALASGNGLCGQSFTGLSTWSGGGYSSVC